MRTSDQAIVDAILRTDFISFLRRCMATLNPGNPLIPNWHLEAIAYQLDRIRTGEINRLVINLPPRHLKSIMASVAFPAYLLGKRPQSRIFGISYSADLAAKHTADFRSIVQSRWYQRAFPGTTIKRATDDEILTTKSGFRRSTSINASITGLGGEFFIIDDPQKPVDAQSEAQRSRLNGWFSNTLLSRLDDKATGSIIVVMQRVHQNDLTGHILEQSNDWTVLSLPAIAERSEEIPLARNRFYRREAGEALHSDREPLRVLEKIRSEMGSDIFAAQYQQTPVPAGGAMIKRNWLRYYDGEFKRTWKMRVVQSWDIAAKTGPNNDWSVCTTWIIDDGAYYLLDLTRGRYEFPELRRITIELAQRFKPHRILIEDASAGTALIQELTKMRKFAIRAVPVERDKVTRLYVQQAKFESGQVLFPRKAAFLPALETELLTFPQSKTDDQVDSISQALNHQFSGYDSTLSWVRTPRDPHLS